MFYWSELKKLWEHTIFYYLWLIYFKRCIFLSSSKSYTCMAQLAKDSKNALNDVKLLILQIVNRYMLLCSLYI